MFPKELQSVQTLCHASQGDSGGLPLYLDEWVDDLLSRLFAVLGHLDEPSQQGTAASGSFLMGAGSPYK